MNQGMVLVLANIACATIEMEGMKAENAMRAHRGETPAYDRFAFANLIAKWGLGANCVTSFLDRWRGG